MAGRPILNTQLKTPENQKELLQRTLPYERIAVTVVVLFAVCFWVYTAHAILASPSDQRVQFVPDDAYYYLTLARNFVNQGQWSFDSGFSLTSGFHPLHAYALAAVYSVTRASTEQFVSYGIMLSFVLALPAVLLAAFLSVRACRPLAGLMLLLLVLSRNFSLNTISTTEWGWVVSISAFYHVAFWFWCRAQRRFWLVALLLLGLLGSLSRTDFGLMPAALAVASIPGMRTSVGRLRAAGAFAGLTAAVSGILVGLCHNYLATGEYLQSSARIKSLWLNTYSPSPLPIIAGILSLFGEASVPVLVLVSMMALVAILLGMRRFGGVLSSLSDVKETGAVSHTESTCATLWFGGLFAIAGYVAFYCFNPAGIQHWYTASLIVPICLLITLPFLDFRLTHPMHAAVLTILLILVVRHFPMALAFPRKPEWPHQVSMYRAGHYLHQRVFEGRIGSWNAGIIGYYEGGRVVNLDGLVNNDIYEYAERNELATYIDEGRIEYIVDFVNMLSSEDLRRRGGYDSPDFVRRLVPVRRFDERSDGWHGLTLYEVQDCEADRVDQSDERRLW